MERTHRAPTEPVSGPVGSAGRRQLRNSDDSGRHRQYRWCRRRGAGQAGLAAAAPVPPALPGLRELQGTSHSLPELAAKGHKRTGGAGGTHRSLGRLAHSPYAAIAAMKSISFAKTVGALRTKRAVSIRMPACPAAVDRGNQPSCLFHQLIICGRTPSSLTSSASRGSRFGTGALLCALSTEGIRLSRLCGSVRTSVGPAVDDAGAGQMPNDFRAVRDSEDR